MTENCEHIWSLGFPHDICRKCSASSEGIKPGKEPRNGAKIPKACEPDPMFEALSFLVRLKDHKQEHGKDDFYRKNKHVAWERAREALKSHYTAKSKG